MLITFTFGAGSSAGAADDDATGGAAEAVSTGGGGASDELAAAETFGGAVWVGCCFPHATREKRRRSPFGRIADESI